MVSFCFNNGRWSNARPSNDHDGGTTPRWIPWQTQEAQLPADSPKEPIPVATAVGVCCAESQSVWWPTHGGLSTNVPHVWATGSRCKPNVCRRQSSPTVGPRHGKVYPCKSSGKGNIAITSGGPEGILCRVAVPRANETAGLLQPHGCGAGFSGSTNLWNDDGKHSWRSGLPRDGGKKAGRSG